MKKLKPCPFCGSNVFAAAEYRDYTTYKLEIECPRCGTFIMCRNPHHKGIVRDCYDIWNTRVKERYQYEICDWDDCDCWE